MVLKKKSRLGMFFGANVLGFLILMSGQFNGDGILPTLAVLALFGYFIVFRSSDYEPVMVHMTTLVCMDVCGFAAMNHVVLFSSYAPENITKALNGVGESSLLLLVGIVVCVVGIARLPWLMGVGGGMVGLSLIFGMYGDGSIQRMHGAGQGRTIAAVFLLVAVFWTVCLYISDTAKSRTEKGADSSLVISSAIVFLVSLYIAVACAPFAGAYAEVLAQKIVALPQAAFAWWRVLVCCVVLIGMAYAFSCVGGKALSWGFDSIVMLSWAVLVVGVRVLMDHYFVFSWMLYLALLIAVCRCIGKVGIRSKVLGLSLEKFLAVAIVLFILFACMLGEGLLPSAIVTAVLIVVAYVMFGKGTIAKKKLHFYVVVALAVEALAWLGKRYNSIESFLMVGMVLAFSVAALFVLHRPHPGESRMQDKLAIGVCVIAALLCLLSLRTTVSVDMQVRNNELAITLHAKHKENPATLATSEWKDSYGHSVSLGPSLGVEETVMPIISDHLVVRVVDSVGASEVYDYYFAPWIHGFDTASTQAVDSATPADSTAPVAEAAPEEPTAQ